MKKKPSFVCCKTKSSTIVADNKHITKIQTAKAHFALDTSLRTLSHCDVIRTDVPKLDPPHLENVPPARLVAEVQLAEHRVLARMLRVREQLVAERPQPPRLQALLVRFNASGCGGWPAP